MLVVCSAITTYAALGEMVLVAVQVSHDHVVVGTGGEQHIDEVGRKLFQFYKVGTALRLFQNATIQNTWSQSFECLCGQPSQLLFLTSERSHRISFQDGGTCCSTEWPTDHLFSGNCDS